MFLNRRWGIRTRHLSEQKLLLECRTSIKEVAETTKKETTATEAMLELYLRAKLHGLWTIQPMNGPFIQNLEHFHLIDCWCPHYQSISLANLLASQLPYTFLKRRLTNIEWRD